MRASELLKSLGKFGNKCSSCQRIFITWHSTPLLTEQNRHNKMRIPVILQATLQRLRTVVPASLRAVDRIRHHINTSEEAVRLNRSTTQKKKNWRRSWKLMYSSEMRATAGTGTVCCWSRVLYIFREWFVPLLCVVSMTSLVRNKVKGVREFESLQWRG
jgi:hypothetical protein